MDKFEQIFKEFGKLTRRDIYLLRAQLRGANFRRLQLVLPASMVRSGPETDCEGDDIVIIKKRLVVTLNHPGANAFQLGW
jgi:hypothetical protein